MNVRRKTASLADGLKRASGTLEVFREAVENSTDAVGMSTPEGVHYYQNRAFSELFGEIGTHPPASLYADRVVGEEVFKTIMAGGQWIGEVKMHARDGRILDVFVRAYANRNPAGDIISLVGIHSDVTERKRNEQNLLSRLKMNDFVARVSSRCVNLKTGDLDDIVDQSLEEAGQLTESDRSYLVLYDATCGTLTNTHEWCAEGIPPEIDVLQNTPSDSVLWFMRRLLRFEEIHVPRVADLADDALDLKRVLQAQGIQSMLAVPFICHGSLAGFLGFDSVGRERAWSGDDRQTLHVLANTLAQAFDRVRAEEAMTRSVNQLQATLDALPDLLFETDRDGRIYSYRAPNRELLYADPDAFLGKTMGDVLPPDATRVLAAALAEASETGLHRGAVYSLPFPDGHRWFELSIAAKQVGDKSEGRFVVLVHDITNRKQASDTLQRLNQELEERVVERTAQAENRTRQLRRLTGQLVRSEQRERERIARVLHDDLQQILVGAQYHLHQLHASNPACVEETEALIRKAIKLSSSLTAELSPRLLHEAGLEAALPWLCRQMKATYGLDVQMEVKTAVPADEAGVAILLYQSARELLLNIAKHASVREASVELDRTEDGWVRMCVVDQGCGFVVGEELSTAKGFGLYKIRERMEQIGGTFAIASAPGTGTRVTLCSEIREPESDTSEPASETDFAEDIAGDVKPASAATLRILIADDHALVREGIANILKREPTLQLVGEAADGAEAVAMALRLKPDVVVMDVSMPVMNGIEATRAIRRKLPEVAIVGLSMYDESDRGQAMRQAGATAYLSKIAAPAKLLATIKTVAENRT